MIFQSIALMLFLTNINYKKYIAKIIQSDIIYLLGEISI